MQMLGRSHICNIPVSKDVVMKTQSVNVDECSENDVWCLTSVIQETKHSSVEAAQICASLSDTKHSKSVSFKALNKLQAGRLAL